MSHKLLCGKPVRAATGTFLRELYQPCLREAPDLLRGVFDYWVGALLNTDFEYRWDWAFSFFLSAKLDGYLRHLELLTTYEELPERQRQLIKKWCWDLHFDVEGILAECSPAFRERYYRVKEQERLKCMTAEQEAAG